MNESERFFDAYLRASGIMDFAFEKPLPGTGRLPDYVVPWNGNDLLFEVKERRNTAKDLHRRSGCSDPYEPIRKKIEASRKKFKELDGYCCSLVLHSQAIPLTWRIVYGAMLGNLASSVSIHAPGRPEPCDRNIQTCFSSGGKMHREHKGVPIDAQNRTISAVLVLEQLGVGRLRFIAEARRIEQELGRKLSNGEFGKLMESARGTERDVFSLKPLRVIVHENPYARIPLPRDLFCGPYDERYGLNEGYITRIFVGEELLKLPRNDER